MSLAFFGQYLLSEGIINGAQLTEALRLQEESNRELGQLALEKKILKPAQINETVKLQTKEDLFFGEAAEKLGYLTAEQVNTLLKEQKEHHLYLGDALVKLGYLSEEKRQEALQKFTHEQNETFSKTDTTYPTELKPEQAFIDEFSRFTIKILRRMGGIVAKYGRCELIQKEFALLPMSVGITFSGSLSGRLTQYLLLMNTEVARVVATKVYRQSGLAIDKIYKGTSLTVDEGLVEDVIAEMVNLICGQSSSKFSQGEELTGEVPQKQAYDIAKGGTHSLHDNEKAARILLFTPFGTISFILVFLQ